MKYTKEELERKIKEDTALIAELEGKEVEPEYYCNSAGEPYRQYPKGVYASHLQEIKDAYWRRRNWREKLENLELEEKMLHFTVKDGDSSKNYIGFAPYRWNHQIEIPIRQTEHTETWIAFLNVEGSNETYVVQKNHTANGFAELDRYYQDSFGWPKGHVKMHAVQIKSRDADEMRDPKQFVGQLDEL